MRAPKRIFHFFKDVGKEWVEDEVPRRAAGLAFYTLLSLGPLVLILVSVFGLLLGSAAAESAVVQQSQTLIGAVGADVVRDIVDQASRPGSGGLGVAVGFVLLLFGATGVFGEMQSALNWMWDLRSKPGRGIRGILRSRLVSLGTMAGLAFILIISLVMSEGISALADRIGDDESTGIALALLTQIASFVVALLVFAFAFKVLPDARARWRDLWIGAAVTAVLFTIGKAVLGLYLSHSSTGAYFGVAGSLVVLLVWVYYSAQIFFIGAEITQVYSRRYGSGIRPDESAELISTLPKKPPPKKRAGKRTEG